jgi:hypothetical protein
VENPLPQARLQLILSPPFPAQSLWAKHLRSEESRRKAACCQLNKKITTLCMYEGFSGNYALDYALISAP